ncbi:hypothetical protein COL940_011571 [Colletotrichum noveboracense]|nr:hypothetical protein COL940_011571 [Colletotrichum noveboracense]
MDDVQAWIESLAFMEGGDIGIFPLARYPGWTNLVWRMEVEVYSNLTNDDNKDDDNDKDNDNDNDNDNDKDNDKDKTIAHDAPAHSSSVVKLELDETVHVLRQLNDLANQLADLQFSSNATPEVRYGREDTRHEV